MKRNQKLVPLSLFFGLVSIAFIWFGNPDRVIYLTREDGAIENLSAIFYLLGFLVCLLSIVKKERVPLAIFWAALCFLFLGEETSWFQRLFDYSVPAVEQKNVQHEFNLHNLGIFGSGRIKDMLGGGMDLNVLSNWLLNSQNLFQIGFLGYFLILPLFLYIPKINALILKTGYRRPDISFVLVILFIISLSFFLAFYCSAGVKSALAETREMLFAYFIMIYTVSYVWRSEMVGINWTGNRDS